MKNTVEYPIISKQKESLNTTQAQEKSVAHYAKQFLKRTALIGTAFLGAGYAAKWIFGDSNPQEGVEPPQPVNQQNNALSVLQEQQPFGLGKVDPQVHSKEGVLSIEPELKWTFKPDSDLQSSPAINSDGIIYLGSSFDNSLYAVNPDGTEKWVFDTVGRVSRTPVIGPDGTIYIVDSSGGLYAVNPDGTEKWYNNSNRYCYNYSPTVNTDGMVIMGTCTSTFGEADYLHEVDMDGSRARKFEIPNLNPVLSSATIGSGGTIYVGSRDYNLYAINSDWTKKWSYRTKTNRVDSTPAIAEDGTVYVTVYYNGLYAINNHFGIKEWVLALSDLEDVYVGSPKIGPDQTIYVGASDHNLYAVNPDGTKKWTFETGGRIQADPMINSDGTVYVGCIDHNLYAINPDGTKKWTFDTGNQIYTSPVMGPYGRIFVVSGSQLYALMDGSMSPIPSPQPALPSPVPAPVPVPTPSPQLPVPSPIPASSQDIYTWAKIYRGPSNEKLFDIKEGTEGAM